jgi:hypothetical protein
MRLFTTTLLIFALAGTAMANSGKKEGKKKGAGASNRIKAEWTVKNDVIPEYKLPDEANAARAVDIPVVVAPIAVNGHLVNYAFISIRVVLKNNVDTWKIRAKSHFMRDAVVRAAHKDNFGKAGERSELDKEHALALVRTAISPWVTDSQIDNIEFLSVDMLNG